jgi:hypothetical protein
LPAVDNSDEITVASNLDIIPLTIYLDFAAVSDSLETTIIITIPLDLLMY